MMEKDLLDLSVKMASLKFKVNKNAIKSIESI